MNKSVLSIMAHPDDAEFLCAGTMARLGQMGWEVHIATLAPGDCGSKDLPPHEISRIRKAEARKSAELVGGTYHCLDCLDVLILYDEPTILKVISLIRKTRPSIVFTHSPSDYMVDHENSSQLARTGSFGGGIPNLGYGKGLGEVLDWIPTVYYATPMEGKDRWGVPVEADCAVDITSTFELKREMLACHDSQRQWLKAHHGVDEYLNSMTRWTEEQGRRIGVKYAEGFRQERGHAYPSDNILVKLLGAMQRKSE